MTEKNKSMCWVEEKWDEETSYSISYTLQRILNISPGLYKKIYDKKQVEPIMFCGGWIPPEWSDD